MVYNMHNFNNKIKQQISGNTTAEKGHTATSIATIIYQISFQFRPGLQKWLFENYWSRSFYSQNVIRVVQPMA